jgi:antitoxin component of RelBE/YafQ-DinJ toxin-antitoxin module
MTDTTTTPAAPSVNTGTAAPVTQQANAKDAKGTPEGTAEAKAKAEAKKLKIKDLELDEDAAYREIQRARQTNKLLSEAQRRAELADEKEKAMAAKTSKYKQDLGALFEDLGLDDDTAADLAAQYIYRKQVLPSQMSPEEKRVAELEARLAQYEEEKKTFAQRQEEAQRAEIVRQESEKLQAELVEAAKAGRIPSTQYGMKRIAAKLLELEERGLSAPLEQVAAAVREESGREFGEIASSATVADLREWLGDSAFKAFSKKVLDYFLGQVQSTKSQTRPPQTSVTSSTSEKLTPSEFLKRMEGRK